MKYRIGICDDESMMLKINELYISEVAKKLNLEFEICAFESGETILESARKVPFNIVFLDIDMQGMTGISVAVQLKRLYKDVIIIFITGHKEFAVDAFEVDAVGYLVKPIHIEKMEKLLKKAINIISMYKNRVLTTTITIVEDNLKKKIIQYKIKYIEKVGNQCEIHTVDGVHMCYSTIGKMLEELEEVFWQVNQGVVVNRRYIQNIIKNEVVLKDGTKYTLGRKYAKRVKEDFFGIENK